MFINASRLAFDRSDGFDAVSSGVCTQGDSTVQMTGVPVGNFEKNPEKVSESRLAGLQNFQP